MYVCLGAYLEARTGPDKPKLHRRYAKLPQKSQIKANNRIYVQYMQRDRGINTKVCTA